MQFKRTRIMSNVLQTNSFTVYTSKRICVFACVHIAEKHNTHTCIYIYTRLLLTRHRGVGGTSYIIYADIILTTCVEYYTECVMSAIDPVTAESQKLEKYLVYRSPSPP